MDFAGEFETHLTIGLSTPDEIRTLRTWADRHGLKCVHILLARGRTASQPMLTRRGHGTLSAELAAADALRGQLTAAGFAVTRVKIEATPWNADVPQTDAQAAGHPPDRHFEHHVKLLPGESYDEAALAGLATRHAAHLSRNALKARPDGRRERFVTQRCYAVGRATAGERLAALRADLVSAGYELLDMEEEYVVYDSNVAIDAGWLEPQEQTR